VKKILLVPLALLGSLVPTGIANAAPAAPATNPVGTVRWLPENTNESSRVPNGLHRLVVVYDRSTNQATGKPTSLLAKGAFGLKIASTSPDLRMKGHSPAVDPLEGSVPALNEALIGLQGDVRDGACSRAGTPSFSAAFSTTRTFFHPGSSPYAPQTAAGACEVVESSIAGSGGFETRVTTHVPGFWVDLDWPENDQTGGQLLPEVWYEAAYDTEGQQGDFPETADAAGSSKSVSVPGTYDMSFTAAAAPGGFGPPYCPGFGPNAPPGTYSDVTFTAPAGTRFIDVKLYPKLDWDLRLTDPSGSVRNSAADPGEVEHTKPRERTGHT
jgi:hypothetical protein